MAELFGPRERDQMLDIAKAWRLMAEEAAAKVAPLRCTSPFSVLEGAMRTFVLVLILSGIYVTLGLAQPPNQSTARNVLQQQSSQNHRPSPAERARCNQPRKALNAASRRACRSIGK
jgi:hypothetical protein